MLLLRDYLRDRRLLRSLIALACQLRSPIAVRGASRATRNGGEAWIAAVRVSRISSSSASGPFSLLCASQLHAAERHVAMKAIEAREPLRRLVPGAPSSPWHVLRPMRRSSSTALVATSRKRGITPFQLVTAASGSGGSSAAGRPWHPRLPSVPSAPPSRQQQSPVSAVPEAAVCDSLSAGTVPTASSGAPAPARHHPDLPLQQQAALLEQHSGRQARPSYAAAAALQQQPAPYATSGRYYAKPARSSTAATSATTTAAPPAAASDARPAAPPHNSPATAVMAVVPAAPAADFVEGVVDRIVYRSDASGFTVFRVKARQQGSSSSSSTSAPSTTPETAAATASSAAEASSSTPVTPSSSSSTKGSSSGGGGSRSSGKRAGAGVVTVTGPFGHLSPGQHVRFEGGWTTHKRFGLQLAAHSCAELACGGGEDMAAYLCGAVRGVGPSTATEIVRVFGAAAVQVLDSEEGAVALTRCRGIGPRTAARIKASWDSSRNTRAGAEFLHQAGVPACVARQVVRRHGAAAEQVVTMDPYEALLGVRGASFRMAEGLARAVGAPPELPSRVGFAMLHCLQQAAAAEGHTYLPWQRLKVQAWKLLRDIGSSDPAYRERLLLDSVRAMDEDGHLACETASDLLRRQEAAAGYAVLAGGLPPPPTLLGSESPVGSRLVLSPVGSPAAAAAPGPAATAGLADGFGGTMEAGSGSTTADEARFLEEGSDVGGSAAGGPPLLTDAEEVLTLQGFSQLLYGRKLFTDHQVKTMVGRYSEEELAQVLGAPDAEAQLQRCKGIGPVKAAQIKASWDRKMGGRKVLVAAAGSMGEHVWTEHSLYSPPHHHHPATAAAAAAATAAASSRNDGVVGVDVDSGQQQQEAAGLGFQQRQQEAAEEMRCYLPAMRQAEESVAAAVARLARAAAAAPVDPGLAARVDKWVARFERKFGSLSEGQRQAIRLAATSPIVVITGGPGCGKTHVTRALVELWRKMPSGPNGAHKKRVRLCAPTGRAAQRLQEVAGMSASTIHRLLGYIPTSERGLSAAGGSGGGGGTLAEGGGGGGNNGGSRGDDAEEALAQSLFRHNRHNKLQGDCFLVDEASMLDLPLAAALMEALPSGNIGTSGGTSGGGAGGGGGGGGEREPRSSGVGAGSCQVVLVGDADQLPPVGPGSVLADVIRSGVVPVVDLRQIFRQAAQSCIVTGAHAINRGQLPSLQQVDPITLQPPAAAVVSGEDRERPPDALWVPLPDNAAAGGDGGGVQHVLLQVVAALRSRRGVDVARDLQVLSPMRKGPAGTTSLNLALQSALNPAEPGKEELLMSSSSTMLTSSSSRGANGNGSGGQQQVVLRVGDRVVQSRNDYDNEVYNGDIGYVTHVDQAARSVTVEFPTATSSSHPLPPPPAAAAASSGHAGSSSGAAAAAPDCAGGGGSAGAAAAGGGGIGSAAAAAGGNGGGSGAGAAAAAAPRVVTYVGSGIDSVEPAWATTVHKAQGRESDVVLLLLSPLHRRLLTRQVLYTAVTRARKLLVVVGSPGAIATAVASKSDQGRLSTLGERLGVAAGGGPGAKAMMPRMVYPADYYQQGSAAPKQQRQGAPQQGAPQQMQEGMQQRGGRQGAPQQRNGTQGASQQRQDGMRQQDGSQGAPQQQQDGTRRQRQQSDTGQWQQQQHSRVASSSSATAAAAAPLANGAAAAAAGGRQRQEGQQAGARAGHTQGYGNGARSTISPYNPTSSNGRRGDAAGWVDTPQEQQQPPQQQSAYV